LERLLRFNSLLPGPVQQFAETPWYDSHEVDSSNGADLLAVFVMDTEVDCGVDDSPNASRFGRAEAFFDVESAVMIDPI